MKVSFRVDISVDTDEYDAPVDGDVKSALRESLEYCCAELELEDGVTVLAVRST